MSMADITLELGQTPQSGMVSTKPSRSSSAENLKATDVTTIAVSSNSSTLESSISDEPKQDVVEELVLPGQRGINDTQRQLSRKFSLCRQKRNKR